MYYYIITKDLKKVRCFCNEDRFKEMQSKLEKAGETFVVVRSANASVLLNNGGDTWC